MRDRGVPHRDALHDPVLLLTDGYIANAAEPWKVPDMSGFEPFPVTFFDTVPAEGQQVMPPRGRGDGLARPWIKPGTLASSTASAGSSSPAPAISITRPPRTRR